ncbi:MAG TPA: hypothetical protein VGH30_05825 [Jatrophihabitantaceae bacterium]
MTESNPLVVDEPRTGLLNGTADTGSGHEFDGGGAFFDFASTIKDGANENWVGLGIDVAGDALDVLGFCEDPLQGLLSAGIGWLIEHISFLSEPLDYLAGNPEFVQERAQTWANIKQALDQASQDYLQSAQTLLQQYTGSAATAYGKSAQNFAQGISSTASHADNAKNAMTVAAAIVGTTRGLVRDWISTFVSAAIEKAAVALATSFLDFGASLAAYIADEVAEASILADKTASKLSELADELSQLAEKASQSASTAERAAATVSKDATKLTKQTSSSLKNASKFGRSRTAEASRLAKQAGKTGAYSTKTAEALKNSRAADRDLKEVLKGTDKADEGLVGAGSATGGLHQGLVNTSAQAGHVESQLQREIDKLQQQRRVITGRRLGVDEKKLAPDRDLGAVLDDVLKDTPKDVAGHGAVEVGRQSTTERENRAHELEEQQEERGELPDGSLLETE